MTPLAPLILTQTADFRFKQWGNWAPLVDRSAPPPKSLIRIGDSVMVPLGKKGAGRLLDGRTWDGLPMPLPVPG